MPTVSEQLRQARLEQSLTVQQVVDITKIRSDHLRAIEDGNFDVFSAPVYIKGFIRSYANLLKLDVRQIMAELDAELRQTEKFAELPPLSDEPPRILDFLALQFSKLDWQKGVIIAGILGCMILAFSLIVMVKHHHKADPLSGLKPAVYQNTQRLSGEKLPLPSRGPKQNR